MRHPLCAAVLGAALSGGLLAAADRPLDGLEISEWTVPWPGTRPRDPYAGPDGRVWFVGQTGDYLAVFDPATGQFKRYDLDPGTGPHNLIVDQDGMVWYAGNRNGLIGRLNPMDGSVARYRMPDPEAGDPHTLVFDPRGDIWFTVQAGGAVGKLETRTGAIRLVRVPTRGARPYGIAVDSKGRPWFAEFGTNKLGTVDPVSFELAEYTVPDEGARPRRIVIGPDDRAYLGDYALGRLWRFDPGTAGFTSWQNPAGARSAPYAMAGDDRGRVWLVETGPQPNRFVALDTRTERFGNPVPIAKSGGIVVRHMMFDSRTRSIWFATDAGTIGRARVP